MASKGNADSAKRMLVPMLDDDPPACQHIPKGFFQRQRRSLHSFPCAENKDPVYLIQGNALRSFHRVPFRNKSKRANDQSIFFPFYQRKGVIVR